MNEKPLNQKPLPKVKLELSDDACKVLFDCAKNLQSHAHGGGADSLTLEILGATIDEMRERLNLGGISNKSKVGNFLFFLTTLSHNLLMQVVSLAIAMDPSLDKDLRATLLRTIVMASPSPGRDREALIPLTPEEMAEDREFVNDTIRGV